MSLKPVMSTFIQIEVNSVYKVDAASDSYKCNPNILAYNIFTTVDEGIQDSNGLQIEQ